MFSTNSRLSMKYFVVQFLSLHVYMYTQISVLLLWVNILHSSKSKEHFVPNRCPCLKYKACAKLEVNSLKGQCITCRSHFHKPSHFHPEQNQADLNWPRHLDTCKLRWWSLWGRTASAYKAVIWYLWHSCNGLHIKTSVSDYLNARCGIWLKRQHRSLVNGSPVYKKSTHIWTFQSSGWFTQKYKYFHLLLLEPWQEIYEFLPSS